MDILGFDLARLFAEQRTRLEAYLLGYVRCRATAADLTQEAFLRLARLRGAETAPAVADPASFLYRVARNLAIDHLRTATRHAVLDAAAPVRAADPHATPAPEAALAAREEWQVLRAALVALEPRTRRVFLMAKADGQSYAEIAQALGISVSAVEKNMMKALLACRVALDRARGTA
jgi:RNA polymerase sigma factor (sigma-70 family)